jgi:hypothetical protein
MLTCVSLTNLLNIEIERSLRNYMSGIEQFYRIRFKSISDDYEFLLSEKSEDVFYIINGILRWKAATSFVITGRSEFMTRLAMAPCLFSAGVSGSHISCLAKMIELPSGKIGPTISLNEGPLTELVRTLFQGVTNPPTANELVFFEKMFEGTEIKKFRTH